MASVNTIVGVEQVLARLRAKTMAMSLGCSRGLRLAGLMLQRESQRLVPVDYGVLKASAFTRSFGAGFSTQVIVGYTAEYAIYVHENVEMKLKGQPRPPPHKGKYWDPQGRGQSKFLEEPARRLRGDMRRVILDQIKIL